MKPEYLAGAATEAVEVAQLPGNGGAPVVSVVVPAYNHQHLLPDLLDALVPQLGRMDAELIVVDDGSTDRSFEVLVRYASELRLRGKIIRLPRNRGRSVARNVGIVHAQADVIAFTDSDCVPADGWLTAGLAALADASLGIVQGRTRAHPDQPQPLFNHFIDIAAFDGTFSTCNVFYRKQALVDAGGFDPTVDYWEDVDLGWRVRRNGWPASFAAEAVVYHQVLRLSPLAWLAWPRRLGLMPDKVAAYPEYRQHLFLGIWVHWFNALFDLAVLSVPLAGLFDRRWLVLAAPYLIVFPSRHGLAGRWPFAKAGFHLAWDAISFLVLLANSARRRALVL